MGFCKYQENCNFKHARRKCAQKDIQRNADSSFSEAFAGLKMTAVVRFKQFTPRLRRLKRKILFNAEAKYVDTKAVNETLLSDVEIHNERLKL